MSSLVRTELQRARDWSGALATALDAAAREVGHLARQLASGWPDENGREWAEWLLTMRNRLERDADAAVRLGLQVERAADEPTDLPPSGPRLGGTGARRADDERGVRIPRLDERADG